MKTIVKFAVFIAILYAAFIYGKPHLDRLTGNLGLGDLGGGGSEPIRCVAVAERTVETFTDMVKQRATPPINKNRWAGSYKMAEGRLSDAELSCQCSGEACELGSQALDMLSQYMRDWDVAVQNGEPMLDAARALEQIYSRLGRAKAIAR